MPERSVDYRACRPETQGLQPTWTSSPSLPVRHFSPAVKTAVGAARVLSTPTRPHHWSRDHRATTAQGQASATHPRVWT